MTSGLYPAGLTNLGNTCYMNSTIQTLRAIPELHAILKKYSGSVREGDNPHNLTVSLRDLLNLLTNTNQPVPPLVFLRVLRSAFPQFAQQAPNGAFMQQDAEECWTQILLTLGQKLAPLKPADESAASTTAAAARSAVAQLLSGEMSYTITNTENPDEPKVNGTDMFQKLSCHITSSTNYMLEGIKQSLEETITKHSEQMGKEAKYLKSSRLSRLPYYLNIQFVRFWWRQDKQVKAKIMRPVEFPLTLDVYELCSDALKEQLAPKRKQLQAIEEKRAQELQQQLKNKGKGKEEEENKEPPKPAAEVSLDPSAFVNDTGMYELCAVISHKGRLADSGHYVAWVKEAENKWLLYDDDRVSYVDNEEIKKLSGKGGGALFLKSFLLKAPSSERTSS